MTSSDARCDFSPSPTQGDGMRIRRFSTEGGLQQVCTLKQFYSFGFLQEMSVSHSSQIYQDTCQQEYCSLSYLPAPASSWSQNLEGSFKLTQCPSRVFSLTVWVASRTKGNIVPVRSAGLCTEVLKPTDSNLDCECLKNHYFSQWSLNVRKWIA